MKRLLWILLLAATPALGQGAFYQFPNTYANSTAYVCPVAATANPCPSPSSIFSDSALSVPITQPITIGASGNYAFWAAGGQYTIQVQRPYNAVYTITLGGGSATGTVLASGTPTANQGAIWTDATHIKGVTYSGDATISGTGAVTIAANAVTLAKQAANTANTLQGFDNGGAAADVTIGSGLSLASGTLAATATGPAACSTVSFSATPTFDGTSSTNCFSITLTADVTSSTCSNLTSGQTYTFIVIQDSTGGRKFTACSQMKQYTTWMATASNRVIQQFMYDGTNLNSISPWTLDTRPFTANAMDDEADGNSCNTSSLWTWVNQGTSTCTQANGILTFTPQQGTNSFAVRFLEQTAPATPWTITTATIGFNNGGNTNQRIGICVSDGTKLIMMSLMGPTNTISVDTYATTTSSPVNQAASSVNVTTGSGTWTNGTKWYARVQDDGTNLNWSFSRDNKNYFQLSTALRGAFLTTGPTQVGLCGDGTTTATSAILLYQDVDWFRRTQ